jgi:hypothetical protein
VFLPRGLRRFHESPHFITFSCCRRQPNFVNAAVYDLTTFFLPPFRQKAGERMGHPAVPAITQRRTLRRVACAWALR